MKPSRQLKLGIAWFRPEQWSRLLEISEDSEDLEETFAEWESLAEEKLRDLRAQGQDAEKVTIDVEELLVWCKRMGLSVNASARSHYVAELLRKRDFH
ncbi:MAG TPA: hypothetical protein VEG60_08760 [Candidatus Binatia bacterium]|nr:hypothetical protein [Candidatus Binatia bacterium]